MTWPVCSITACATSETFLILRTPRPNPARRVSASGRDLRFTVIGTVLGIIAGYKGGVVDEVITFFTNMILVIPNLPLLLVLAAFIGQASPLVIAVDPRRSPRGPGACA